MANLPPQSSGKPPGPPRRPTAVASFGEPEDEFERRLIEVIEAARRRELQKAASSLVGGNSADLNRDEFWQGVRSVDQTILQLLEKADHVQGADLQHVISLVEGRRAVLADQIALEKLVRPPQREGHLPFYADDELIASYEHTLELLDKILGALRAKLPPSPPEGEGGKGDEGATE